MLANFCYLISVGVVYIFLYTRLLGQIYLYGLQEKQIEKYIRLFALLSIFPSITLLVYLTMGLFNIYILYFILTGFVEDSLTPYDRVVMISLSLLWIMPTIFLIIKPYLSKQKNYYYYFLIWYGIIAILMLILLYGVKEDIWKLLTKSLG